MKASIGEPEAATDRYFGHENRVHLPEGLCLIGCVFCLVEHESGSLKITSSMKQALIKNIIKLGGQFENTYTSNVTHVLCETQTHATVQQAISDNKRCVTIFWLNEILEGRKMIPPNRIWHLPRSFNKEQSSCIGKVWLSFFFKLKQKLISLSLSLQIICSSNFSSLERNRLEEMVILAGGRYTSYMSSKSSVLVCKK